MQNNRILAVAIASTLCSGVAYGSFENVRDGMNPATLDTVYSPRRPIGVFDFGTETVVRVNDPTGTYGTVYASELFGDARTLPSAENSQGTYAAVVYTIDGKISDDFEMTFTLTNGATFDGEPLLGVDDSGSGGSSDGNVSAAYAANVSNVEFKDNTTTFSQGEIFRFSGHSTLYKVITATADSGKNYLEFVQVGTGDQGTTAALGLTQAIDGTSIEERIYKYLAANEAQIATGANIVNVSNGLATKIASTHADNAAGSNNSVANLINDAGIDNIIVGAYYRFATDPANSYKVTDKASSVCSPTENCIKLEPNYPLASNFPNSDTLTRIYKKDDTLLHVGNADMLVKGDIYQIANHTQFYTIKDIDRTNGNNVITVQELNKTTGLAADIPAGANGIPLYHKEAFNLSSGAEAWIKGGGHETSITAATGHGPDALPLKAKTGTGSGKSTATFLIPASKHTDLNLETGDRMMLLYKLGSTKALASPGQKINMTVALATSLTNIKVNPARELTVASSKPGIKVLDMKPLEGGEIKISVLSDSKEFTGDGAPFIGTNEAKIGLINLDNDDSTSQEVKAADGETKFEIGKTGALADKSTLQITDGQFAASLKTPGTVLVQAGTTNLQADTVTETDATWNLHDTGLIAIEAAILDKTAIHFKVDGSTAINVPENNPHATLTIDFDDTKMTDLTIEADLRKIKKDGTICHIYNVPNTTAADALSVRITNDSAVAGKLTVALYNMDGTEAIAAGTELFEGEEIKPDETRRISAADLETLAGAAWSGRARAVISSTLPKLAVLALLRQNVPGGALVNMSVGATGNSCNND